MSNADQDPEYHCSLHDFETNSMGQMKRHIDQEHPGGIAKDMVEEFRVEDDEQQEREGPWDDAELVIYTTPAEDSEADPCTEWGRHLGLLSFSLWARFEEREAEVPIYSASETGAWLSLSSQHFHPDPAEPVSDAFVEAVVNMVDEDVGDDWGDPTEESFEAMRDVEKQLWGSLRWAYLKMESPEAAGVIDWCKKRVDTENWTETDDA